MKKETTTETLRQTQGDRSGGRTRDLLLPLLLSGQVALASETQDGHNAKSKL